MAPLTFDQRDEVSLERQTHEWVRAGLISEQQAESIKQFEHVDEPVDDRRLTVVAEVASYLGSVIAFAGGAAIIGPNWDELGLFGQLALGVAIAVVGFTVGAWLVHLAEAGTARLGSFLWAVGTGGVALAVAVVVHRIDPRNGGWYAVAVGVPVLAIGVGLWRNLDRPIQLLTGAVGVLVVGGGIVELTDVPIWAPAALLWAASLVFGVLAAVDVVHPRLEALVVAATGLMFGSMMFGEQSERFAAVLAVASAATVVAFALHDRSWPLVGIGLFAFLISTTMLMQTVLQGTVARLIAVVAGLIVVAFVAMRAQRMDRPGPAT